MRRYLSLCFVVSLMACGGASDKPPPPAAGQDAASDQQPDASVDQAQDAGGPDLGLDAAWQDPGLNRKDGGAPYPSSPYGTSAGKVIDNSLVVLYGYPMGNASDPKNRWSTIQLADFYNPDGSKLNFAGVPYKTLFINVSARWCTVCQAEAAQLQALCSQYAPKGMGCYTAIFEDAAYNPATRDDVNFWMENYDLEFPICLDNQFLWGAFFKVDATPLNMFVDLKTMKIVDRMAGVPPEGWDPYFDEYTRCASSVCPDGGM
jgi:thiol-disulfide isomerase/thioredoxin